MKKILGIIFIVLLFQGCISEKRCARRYPPQVTTTDSVYAETLHATSVRELIRDTIIKIAPDSSAIQMLINCDSLNQAYLSRIISYESGKNVMIPEVSITTPNPSRGGELTPPGEYRILTVKCRVDSMAVYAKIKNRVESLIVETRSASFNETQRIVETPEQPTKFQRFITIMGWLFSGCIVIAIIMAVNRFKNVIKNMFK